MNQEHPDKHMPDAAVQNRVFHSYVFLEGKLEGVKILSNLQSHATNKESLQGLHDMRCQSHRSVVIQLHLPYFWDKKFSTAPGLFSSEGSYWRASEEGLLVNQHSPSEALDRLHLGLQLSLLA